MTQRRKEDWLKRREAEKEKIGGEVEVGSVGRLQGGKKPSWNGEDGSWKKTWAYG